MNTRKFYLILCTVISLFLFTVGTSFLFYVNSSVEASEEIQDPQKKSVIKDIIDVFRVDKKPFNTLLMVTDADGYRTDTMMLINFNPSTAEISVLSIPRDTKVDVKGHGSNKINAVYALGGQGPEGAKFAAETVSRLLGVNIRYYAFLNIRAFREIIDCLGGVEFNVPVDMDYDDPTQNLHIHLKKGKQILYGEQAEQLLRFRKTNSGYYSKEMLQYYDGSDIKRTEMQMNFIKELIKQKANIKYIAKINEVLDVVFKNVMTNVSLNDALKMSHNLNKINQNEVKAFRVSGQDKYINGVSYFIYDGTIYDVNSKETLDAQQVLKTHFISEGRFSDYLNQGDLSNGKSGGKKNNTGSSGGSKTNNSGSSANNKDTKPEPSQEDPKGQVDFTDNNPSNSETSIEGNPLPEP